MFIKSLMEIAPTSFGDVAMKSAIEPTELRSTAEIQPKSKMARGICTQNLLYRM